MRLIDADKTNVYTYELDKQVFVDVINRFISLQPTVDAIPVEWIKKQIEKYATFEFHLDVDDIEARACLKYLLEDWEKENE